MTRAYSYILNLGYSIKQFCLTQAVDWDKYLSVHPCTDKVFLRSLATLIKIMAPVVFTATLHPSALRPVLKTTHYLFV